MSEVVSIVDNHCYAEQKFPSQERLPFLFFVGTFQVVAIPDSKVALDELSRV
jgi:hypothetical protein